MTLSISESVICLKVFFVWCSPSFFDICMIYSFLSFNFNLPTSLCLAVFYKQHLVVFSLSLPRNNLHINIILFIHLKSIWDFSGGPVVKTLHFQWRNGGLTPDLGTKIPHVANQPPPRQKKKVYNSMQYIVFVNQIWQNFPLSFY